MPSDGTAPPEYWDLNVGWAPSALLATKPLIGPETRVPRPDFNAESYPHFTWLRRWSGRVRSPRRGSSERTSLSIGSASRGRHRTCGRGNHQLGNPTQKGSVGLQAFGRPVKLGREDLEGRHRRVRRGGAVVPGGIPQRQEADGDDRKRPEQRHQPIR